MSKKKILVPVDFTELSAKVTEQAAYLCDQADAGMVVLHIVDKAADMETAKIKLAERAAEIKAKYHIECEPAIRAGSIFQEIHAEAGQGDYLLVVIGTHGVKGLKQKLLGADILKVITKIPLPVLVLQSTSSFRPGFKKIVLPVATHAGYENLLNAVVMFSQWFHAEVHIYAIDRPGFESPDSLKKNLEKAKTLFDANGIGYERIVEKQTVLSVGFAAQTLQYALKTGADMIAIMSVSSEEYHYFAQQDKENLLTNQSGIPVLCTGNYNPD